MAYGDIIPTRGAIAEELLLEVIGDLTLDDLRRLREAPKAGVPMLQKLRATHHRQARLLAEGRPIGEVAVICGCTRQRLTQLQQDPMFTELVGYYQDQIVALQLEDSARLRDKLIDVAEMAVDELHDRLEDNDKRRAMSTGNVRMIAEMGLDRTVAPPKAALVATAPPAAITINFGTPLRPIGTEEQEPMIEGTVTETKGE